jgi:hypothetical protein
VLTNMLLPYALTQLTDDGMLPNGPGLSPSRLHALLAESGRGAS